MATTPYMGLVLATPSVTTGPEWAQLLNDALEAIDAHAHTTGDGAPINSTALQVTQDLSLDGHGLADALRLELVSQSSAPSGTNILYSEDGELVYVDGLGNSVPITNSGGVAGSPGTIGNLEAPASVQFDDASDLFDFQYDVSKRARMQVADTIMYPYDGTTAYTFAITLKAPAALAASYTLTLPTAVPASTSLVTMSASGALATQAFTSANTANAVVQRGASGEISVGAITGSSTLALGGAITTDSSIAAQGSISGTFGIFTNAITSDSSITADGTLIGANLSISSTATITGALTAPGGIIGSGTGSAIKTWTASGTLASFASTTISPSGASVIYGACGWTQVNGSSVWSAMPDVEGGDVTGLIKFSSSTTTTVGIVSSDGSNSNGYNVIIFYA